MSISVNNNTSSVNWEALLNKLNEATQAAGAQGASGVTAGSNVTVSAKVDGAERTVTFPIPDDLELPEVVDQSAIDALCAKLAGDKSLGLSDADVKAVHAALSEALTAVSSSITPNSKSVMFDLYKLMALLVEVGQKQRDAARELRASQSQQIQTSIQNQVDMQKAAAITGMIGGAVCCIVQVIVSGVMLAKQGSAFKQQLGTLQSSGVDSAKQNLSMLKATNTQETAQRQFQDISASAGQKPGATAGHTVQEEVNADGFNNTNQAETRLADAKTKLANDTDELQKCQRITGGEEVHAADLPDGSVKNAVTKLETLQQKVADAGLNMADVDEYIDLTQKASTGELNVQGRVQLLEIANRFPALKDMGSQTSTQLKAEIQTAAQNRVAELQVEIPRDTQAIEVARQSVRATVKNDLQRFEDEFDNALREVNSITKDTPADQATQLRSTLATAEAKLQYARAYAFKELAKPDVTTAAERAADIKFAGDRVDTAEHGRHLDVRFLKASRTLQAGEVKLGLVNAIGNAVQSLISNMSGYLQAQAKEDEAVQAKEREELDQTKDLFQQAQALVDAVVKLMQAVSSAETQSMRDAIQA